MCFVKKASFSGAAAQVKQEPVVQHHADASATKNNERELNSIGFNQNIKTSPLGLEDDAKVQKKTLLGE